MNIYSQIRSNRIKTYLIIFFFIGIISGFFYIAGYYFNDPAGFFIFGLLFSLFTGVSSYFFSDKIVLKMSGARPATKKEFFDYFTVAENMAIASGLPMPKLYVIDDPTPNAFATGRNPQHAVVAATTGLLSRLERSEIEGVIAHEMSHIKNYDILVMTVVTVLVGTLVYAIDFMMRSMWWGGGSDDRDSRSGMIGLVLIILSAIILPLLATLIQMSVSRKREYLADASGALLTRNPDGLADALEKISAYASPMKHASHATEHLYISNPFGKGKGGTKWITQMFSSHPPIEERIKILRGM